MFTKTTTSTMTALAVAAALTACGGGGGGSDSPTTSTSVTSSGVITGFSSVFVNGTRYELENGTVVAIEDEAESTGDDSRLRLGMRVRVEATERNGQRVADRIEFDEDLKGPVRDVTPDANDPTIGTFTVIGQTVTVDGNTVFDNDVGDNDANPGIDIRDLELSSGQMVVEVSGFPTADGILATRVDRINAPGAPAIDENEVEVKGTVAELDEVNGTFRIRGLTVNYEPTDLDTEDFASETLRNGLFVEVKGERVSDTEMNAEEIEIEDRIGDDDREGEFEIEGVLESVDTAADPDVIVINSITIPVLDASRLVGRVGDRVEVKGTFNADDVLVIREVELDVENSVRTEDEVANVDLTAGTITTRLGLVITPTGTSRIEDDLSDDDGDRLTPSEFLGRVVIGNYIEARGFPNADGNVTWTRVEREEVDQECELRGPVEAGSIDDTNFSFSIQGVTIEAGSVGTQFQAGDDSPISRDAFFSQLAAGDVVEAESENAAGCQTGVLTAREVSFEPDDGVAGTVPPGEVGDDNGGDDNGNDDGLGGNDVSGSVSNLSANGDSGTFDVAGRTVSVSPDTLIDASLVEAARGPGVELGGADLVLGNIPEGLADLVSNGLSVTVRIDGSGNAILIEDND